jgi:gamma-glutamyltranspeptidase/glutathione hydrolase
MNFEYASNPFYSKRHTVFGTKGVVATSQYLAAQAGLEMLKKGGNAVDAAIAAAACLVVTEPVSNGIGGDAFALIWANGKLHGLNSSGPAPLNLSPQDPAFSSGVIPRYGWLPVTVPGAPAAWSELSSKFGKLPFNTLLEPASNLCR